MQGLGHWLRALRLQDDLGSCDLAGGCGTSAIRQFNLRSDAPGEGSLIKSHSDNTVSAMIAVDYRSNLSIRIWGEQILDAE